MEALLNKKVLVMGLGNFGGGLGATQWLVSQGAKVTITDMAPAEKLTVSLEQLRDLPITYKLGGHELADFTSCDLLVVSPAVDKAHSPYVQAARAAGVHITSEMNLFLERCPAFTVGITGSVGKSTTTALIFEALHAALPQQPGSRKVYLGGNIGRSLLMDLEQLTPQDIVVLELSSFMLEDTPTVTPNRAPATSTPGWSPDIAVVTNIFPNHLDRHGTLEEYARAKQNILRFQNPKTGVAILNADHDAIKAWAGLTHGRVVFFSTQQSAPSLPLLMPGQHNQSNAQAALAVVQALPAERFPQINFAAAQQAVCVFKGLSHRLQLVHTSQVGSKNIRWYNDSKATTPEASLTALDAFTPSSIALPNAIFIIGGYDKHIDMTRFETRLAQDTAGVLGIGQTGSVMIEHIKSLAPKSPRPHPLLAEYVETLDRAITQAWHWAQQLAATPNAPAEIAIVLSPASASWGQFVNYEKRGEQFAELAKQQTTT